MARAKRSSRRSNVPKSFQCGDPAMSIYYKTRRHSSRIRTTDLPLDLNARGIYSPWALLWFCLFMVAPLAYIYILLMLLRDLCLYFPLSIHEPLRNYVPFLARLAEKMNNASRLMDIWCVIEALFFIACKLKIQYLQMKDPLEASLSAAPMLDPFDRKVIWDRIMEVEQDDPVTFISGWFFDQPIERISRYDVCDFICWSMFDGRNQEHLTIQELHELEGFLEDFEYRISLKLYGSDESEKGSDSFQEKENSSNYSNEVAEPQTRDIVSPIRKYLPENDDGTISSTSELSLSTSQKRPRPRKLFRFCVDSQPEEPNFFSNLFESYRQRYERYKNILENAEFHPMQDFKNILAETAHHAEESAMATAHSMYETIVQQGSNMDKQLSAFSHATSAQLTEAWNSVKGMKERLETAAFLSQQRKNWLDQLRGNRAMLNRMREMSYAVPSKQMAALMRKITKCYDALERIEGRAKEGFARATGILADKGSSFFKNNEPQRYAKYSADPLLGIATYPLGFHLLVLGASESTLRVLLRNRGFERRYVGPVSYYYHPGRESDGDDAPSGNELKKVPIVFAHGIGIGLITYVPLVDILLNTGQPILLPEIPFVSGFRPWQSPNSVLSPAVVASTMTAMLAVHGFSKGIFVGHSYGTSWLSYTCKYAPTAVAALLFLDPICFCLHFSFLTKRFVYHRPDPGTVSFMVRTDMAINWTIQRAFPWSWITLFVEQIKTPCTVFLSENDALVPAEKVEKYLRSKSIPIRVADAVDDEFFDGDEMNACIFPGQYHGAFTEQPNLLPPIAAACNSLCRKVQKKM